MKPDVYKAVRDLICQARNIFDDDCECCPLYNVDNCYEQTAESEKILLAFFGKHPAEEEEAEKEKEAKRQRPGTNSFNINIKALGEIKELAKNLLPKIHEVKQEEYAVASELAINLAMTFEGIWEQKIGGIDVKETE